MIQVFPEGFVIKRVYLFKDLYLRYIFREKLCWQNVNIV